MAGASPPQQKNSRFPRARHHHHQNIYIYYYLFYSTLLFSILLYSVLIFSVLCTDRRLTSPRRRHDVGFRLPSAEPPQDFPAAVLFI